MERDIIITNMDKSSEIPRGKPEGNRAEGAGRRVNPQEAKNRLDFIKRKAEAFKGETELSFSNALGISRIVNSINEGKDVLITREELTGFKKTAERIFERGDVAKMEPADVVAAAHYVLTRSEVSNPSPEIWEYDAQSPARREEEASAREQIAKAKEAELDPQKTAEHLDVIQEKVGKVNKKSGPGTMGTADEEEQIEWIANLPNPEEVQDEVVRRILRRYKRLNIGGLRTLEKINELRAALKKDSDVVLETRTGGNRMERRAVDKTLTALEDGLEWVSRTVTEERGGEVEESKLRGLIQRQLSLKRSGLVSGEEWQKNEAEIGEMLTTGARDESISLEDLTFNNNEILDFFEISRVLQEESSVLDKDDFELIIPDQLRLEFLLNKQRMEGHFSQKLEKLGEDGKKAILGDISETREGLFTSMRFQRLSKEEIHRVLEGVLEAGKSRENPEYAGIRRWFVEKQKENLANAREIMNRTEVRADPYENKRSIYAAMNFFETIGSSEAFSTARQRLFQLLEAIQASNLDEIEKLDIANQVQAWTRFTPLLILQDEVKGAPKELTERARLLQDESLYHYYRRHSEAVDGRNKSYLVDKDGRQIYVDAFNRVYYYDSEKRAYFYRIDEDVDHEEQVIEDGGRLIRFVQSEIQVKKEYKDKAGIGLEEIGEKDGRKVYKDGSDNDYYYDSDKKAYFYKVDDNPEHDRQVIEKVVTETDEKGNKKKVNRYFREEKAEVLLVSLNLLSEFEGAFIEEYENDRERVNKMQKLLQKDLDLNSPEKDEQWIISYTLNVNKPSSKYYKYYDSKTGMFDWAALKVENETGFYELQEELNKVNKWWGVDSELSVDQKGFSKTALALLVWYRSATFTGADAIYGSFDWETGKGISKTRRELKELVVVQEKLRERLLKKGVSESRVDDLLGETNGDKSKSEGDFELVKAMTWTGSNLARLKMADGMDRLRYFNKQGEHVWSLFSLYTPYEARNASHPLDYFLNEHHGDRDVNRNVRQKIEDEYGGFFNANLLTMVRVFKWVRFDMAPEIWEAIEYNVGKELTKIKSENRDDVLDYIVAKALYDGNVKYEDKSGRQREVKMSLADLNHALVSKRAQGHEIADFYNDRADALEMYEKKYKEYSLQPFEEQLLDMLGSNWSRRDIRRHRNAELWLRAHWKNGRELWKKNFKMKENIANSDMELTINTFINKKFIDEQKGKRAANEIVGRPAWRLAVQFLETADRIKKKTVGSVSFWLSALWDFLATLFKSSVPDGK